jgi:hypothetical protein
VPCIDKNFGMGNVPYVVKQSDRGYRSDSG